MKYLNYFFLVSFLILNACSGSARFTSDDSNEKNFENNDREETSETDQLNFENLRSLKIETGTASYYAHKFHGRPTASGEIYNMHGISAAHISYPLGTILRVTNLNNNLSIILKINDRMPDLRNGRIIDLSLGAAKKLNMIESGVAKVKIEVLKWGQ